MTELAELERDKQLDFEIDMRLPELWPCVDELLEALNEEPEGFRKAMYLACRYAYARGYYDGLADDHDSLRKAAGYPPVTE